MPIKQDTTSGERPLAPETQDKPSDAEQSRRLRADFVIDSVLPSGSGRDTYTVVLRPDENAENENNSAFFKRASGRIQLNDVRNEVGKQLEDKSRVTIEITPTV